MLFSLGHKTAFPVCRAAANLVARLGGAIVAQQNTPRNVLRI
jgi:hypothetical protein